MQFAFFASCLEKERERLVQPNREQPIEEIVTMTRDKMLATARKSRGLFGAAAEPPPPPSAAAPNTTLRTLLATDCSQGRAAHDRDLSCHWNLEDTRERERETPSAAAGSPAAVSPSLPLVSLNCPLDTPSDDESIGIVDDDKDSDDEEEVESEDGNIDDSAMKLVHFPS